MSRLEIPSFGKDRLGARTGIPWIRQRLAAHVPVRLGRDVASRQAAVACILREGDAAGPELLFIRRAQQEQDPWSGHVAFPGGRLDSEDASPLAAARRETWEEVEIDLERSGELLGQLDDILASARGRVIPMSITPYVFLLVEPQTPRINQREVDELLWVPVATLLDPGSASTVPYELDGRRFDLPCFRVQGRVIWGLTYQMLMRLFAVLGWERGQ